jgi:hypothetical protein
MTSGGLPHSGASGSLPACGSPELFAACHALLRPLPPRHPPRALRSLTTPDLTALVLPARFQSVRRSPISGRILILPRALRLPISPPEQPRACARAHPGGVGFVPYLSSFTSIQLSRTTTRPFGRNPILHAPHVRRQPYQHDSRKDPAPGRRETLRLARTSPLSSLNSLQPPAAGGGERIRTADPLLAKQVLSQLSYAPGAGARKWKGDR